MLEGTLKKGNQPHVQPAPGIALKLEEPFHLSIAAVPGKLARKGQLKLKITARRNPAFKGEITLACSPLPKGVKRCRPNWPPAPRNRKSSSRPHPTSPSGRSRTPESEVSQKSAVTSFRVRIPLAGVVVE